MDALTAKQRVGAAFKKTFADEKPEMDRIPAYLITGQCNTQLIGVSIREWLLDPQVFVKAQVAAYERYRPDILLMMWDLLTDAEAMVAAARALLDGRPEARRNVQEFYEPVIVPDLNIAVFGAGHVGSSVVAALSGLDCNIRWIDNRRNMFRNVPGNVRTIEANEPALEVAAMPPGRSLSS